LRGSFLLPVGIRPRAPYTLILLIAAQTICAAFFLWDVVEDFLEAGTEISHLHLLLELLATLGLVAAIVFELNYLMGLLQRQQRLEHDISLAATAMHEIIISKFDEWCLTPTEQDVGMLLVKGFTIAEIAKIRGSAQGTIKAHLNAIYKKSDAHSRAEVLSLLIDPLLTDSLLEGREPARW
jgi:DNA-binding CsgD family transcriptional regulator